jgi:putative chitinase
MSIDVRKLQLELSVAADGIAGRGTFTALFRKLGATQDRAEELALAAVVRFPEYGVMESALRLAHFMAQLVHESGSFKYMEEIWGPTPAQRRYEGRADLGNTQPGDGFRFKGRGPIQLTGRANYRVFGRKIGVDLERHPEIAAVPSVGLWTALEYWKDRNLNSLADRDDVETITRRINGGLNGFADRKAHLAKIKGWLL